MTDRDQERRAWLSAGARQRLDGLSAERLRELLIAFAKGQSLQEMGLDQ